MGDNAESSPSPSSAARVLVGDTASVEGLQFDGVSLRYRPELPQSLIDVSFHIPYGCRCAVVGRTGAGKSSLAVALFRLAPEITGAIRLGPHSLEDPTTPIGVVRKRMGIISQDPFIFSSGATVRYNLDPFKEFSDESCRGALDTVGLAELSLKRKLGETTSSSGATASNSLSAGEKQLLCLARVLLRKPEVLVVDEAMASVDPETDKAVQAALRAWLNTENPMCCVLTIAHRLDTVADYDQMVVMDQGRVAQQGKIPDLVAQGPGTALYDLIQAAGPGTAGLFGVKFKLPEQEDQAEPPTAEPSTAAASKQSAAD